MHNPTKETTRTLLDVRWEDFIPSHYLSANLVDPGNDLTGAEEFSDIDPEFPGLTIVQFDSVLDCVRFLNGYSV